MALQKFSNTYHVLSMLFLPPNVSYMGNLSRLSHIVNCYTQTATHQTPFVLPKHQNKSSQYAEKKSSRLIPLGLILSKYQFCRPVISSTVLFLAILRMFTRCLTLLSPVLKCVTRLTKLQFLWTNQTVLTNQTLLV